MDYKQMQYFVTVAEENSFSKAASRLFLSQQALSKAIDKLEKELDITLFIRTTNGMILTPDGEKLRLEAFHYIQTHESILNSMKKIKVERDNSLTIGYPTGILVNFPRNYLTGFIDAHPELNIKIYSNADDSYNRSMQLPRIDVQLSTTLHNEKLVNIEFYYHQKTFAVMAADHPLSSKDYLVMDDFRGQKLLFLSSETKMTDSLTAACENHGVEPSVYLSTAEAELMMDLIIKNKYLSFFASNMVEFPSGIVQKEIRDLDVVYEFYIVTRKNCVKTPIMVEFIQYTKSFFPS